jgi:hypothetical protein
VIFFAIAFKSTSCSFIVRSIDAPLIDPGFSNLQHRRRLVKRTFHLFVRPDISHTNDRSVDAVSIFSLKDEPEGSGEWGSFLFIVSKGIVVEAVGMWESRSDFQGRWKGRETWVWFCSLSTDRHLHSRHFHADRRAG